MSTVYHSQYFAYQLTRKCSSYELEKLNQSILNATVDLNPHQIDAALFAFRSPLSRGALLADEVGLGKTIEGGLIISQLWAERRRRILCIVPASLRKQWNRELLEKFFIDSVLLESKNYNQFVKQGIPNPFEQTDRIVLCSYQFARSKERDLRAVRWNLVVIDEAHRLRNVYKKSNKIARSLLEAIGDRPKILLTATPFQNSLMELYGLVRFIDPHLFGSEDSFRERFTRNANDMGEAEFNDLRSRIHPICQRTLRRQVTEYIRYTNRVSFTQDFTPTDEELKLYDGVSEYLQRLDSYALPRGQRSLMTLVLRKILASSSFAIAATLGSLIDRLETLHARLGGSPEEDVVEAIGEDFEVVAEMQEEWTEREEETQDSPGENGGLTEEQEKALILKAIRKEADELKSYRGLAESITQNAKGEALLIALKTGFQKAAALGAARKALIFTESRRTQQYLMELLVTNGYGGQIVTLNGTNSDPQSKAVYKRWLHRHEGQEVITGSPTADMRSALVEEFRDRASIMIATESGAEGLNLQFCNLVVNYDLPWNPQRIEQRIGRCHRYGQQHDVVVVNFLNRKNAADQRVFELLSQKLRLFDGVFGTSDEVLGVLESGVDFEKRVNDIYQSCRSTEAINAAFDRLQSELDEQIRTRLEDTRINLLENFDEEVHTRLRLRRNETARQIGRFEDWLWRLTRVELDNYARFDSNEYTFELTSIPAGLDNASIPLGRYRLVTHKDGTIEHQFRLGHPLAEWLLAKAKDRSLPIREVVFHYQPPPRISLVENLRGRSGWLHFAVLSIESLEREDHLVLTGMCDEGAVLDAETCERLFSVTGTVGVETTVPDDVRTRLERGFEEDKNRIVTETTERNHSYFDTEMEKLDKWADDLKVSLEQELRELDKEIKSAKKEARQCADLDAKVELHKKAKILERRRNEKRRNLFDAQDDVDSQKEKLIEDVEVQLKQRLKTVTVFTVRWQVV
jgi:superfamily II DNA or RNA helicase